MVETQYIQFDGLDRPLALEEAGSIQALISRVTSSWPHRTLKTPPYNAAFATIRPVDARHWEIASDDASHDPRVWDDVNVVCDLISDMAWERLRSDPDLLCIHGAAVDFGGQLVVFPNTRRAGKSTLAIALARLGLPLYTDDFLPVRVDNATGAYVGLANGLLPRLRLPLPAEFSAGFESWVGKDPGPSNRQYKYMVDVPLVPWGQKLPLGVMVALDRWDKPTQPRLKPIGREDALEILILQNFARTRHAGALLRSLDTISRNLPIYQLTYHCAEDAAEYLRTAPEFLSLPFAKVSELVSDDRQAPLDQVHRRASAFARDQIYEQASGVTETVAGNDCFLADSAGIEILRLNPMSAAIWRLLQEPTKLDDLTDVVTSAFPYVAPERIEADCERLMRDLATSSLIVPAHADKAVE